jgi:hypothetical protein
MVFLAKPGIRTVFRRIAAAALIAASLTAPAWASPESDRNDAVIATCSLNENGEALLARGLQDARYDYSSGAYMAFRALGFSDTEWNRSLAQQKADVTVRTARLLSRYNDGMTLSLAKNYGLVNFFYDDSLICLKGAFHETKAEADSRVAAEKHAAAKREADRMQDAANAELARKQQAERQEKARWELRLRTAALQKQAAEFQKIEQKRKADEKEAFRAEQAKKAKANEERNLKAAAQEAKRDPIFFLRDNCKLVAQYPSMQPYCDEFARRQAR